MMCTRNVFHKLTVFGSQNLTIRRFPSISYSRIITAALSTTGDQRVSTDQTDGEVTAKKKPATALPVSISPAGTVIRGINFHKGRDDPLALKEEEYPSWLWNILNKEVDENMDVREDADLFSKSKKLRRKASKRQRKMEAFKKEFEELKVPLTQQSIDLPSNEEGTLVGATIASASRYGLRHAMRTERRKGIKEKNYLKSV